MLVQFLVIGLSNEHRVVVEKVNFLLITHADIGVSAQKVMQRGCARFLGTGQNEIELLKFAAPGPKHRSKCKRSFRVRAIVFREALECVGPGSAFRSNRSLSKATRRRMALPKRLRAK